MYVLHTIPLLNGGRKKTERHIVQHTCLATIDSHVVQDRANEDVKVPLFPCTAKYQIPVAAITNKNQYNSLH